MNGSCGAAGADARRRRADPAEPLGLVARARAPGATDLGGLSANGDHISPEHPFPSPHQVRKRLAPEGYALTERLCVYPQYIDPEWMAQGVLDVDQAEVLVVHPAPRLGRAARTCRSAATSSPGAIEGPRRRRLTRRS